MSRQQDMRPLYDIDRPGPPVDSMSNLKRDIPVPDLSKSKHPGGVDMLTYSGIKSPAFDEHMYRKKWLELHHKADNLVFDEKTRMPVRAEYLYMPTQMNDHQAIRDIKSKLIGKE